MAVRLQRELDLAQFFTLEAQLGPILSRPVDLIPETTLITLYPSHSVTWVWQAANVQA